MIRVSGEWTLTLCEKMNPDEANARFVLGKLSSDAIVRLANQWIDSGLYTESLGELCVIKSPVMSEVGPLFASAMKALMISCPGRLEAAMLLVRVAMERVSSGCATPVEEAEFLYWKVHHEVSDINPDKEYVGDSLGLESVFCWLREIWDCRDGSMILYHTDMPRQEAEKKFIEHLKEAAAEWLDKNTQQAAT